MSTQNLNFEINAYGDTQRIVASILVIEGYEQTYKIWFKTAVDTEKTIWKNSTTIPIESYTCSVQMLTTIPGLMYIAKDFRMVDATKAVQLRVYETTGGYTDPTSGIYTFQYGDKVQATAYPDSSYTFKHWLVNYKQIIGNPISITLNSSCDIIPCFEYIGSDKVTVNFTKSGEGIVLQFLSEGSYTFKRGTEIVLNATPSIGYVFDCYVINGERITENPYTLILTADVNLEVVYSKETDYVSIGLMSSGGILTCIGLVSWKKKK